MEEEREGGRKGWEEGWRGSNGAREQGSKGVREQGSKGVREGGKANQSASPWHTSIGVSAKPPCALASCSPQSPRQPLHLRERARDARGGVTRSSRRPSRAFGNQVLSATTPPSCTPICRVGSQMLVGVCVCEEEEGGRVGEGQVSSEAERGEFRGEEEDTGKTNPRWKGLLGVRGRGGGRVSG
eukprot:614512-Rhodomonas_salina.1